jgi:hypothetical protein
MATLSFDDCGETEGDRFEMEIREFSEHLERKMS